MTAAGKGPDTPTGKDHGFKLAGLHTASFLIKVDGLEIGQYTEVSGLEVKVAVEPYEEGGVNDYIHQLPGRMEWTNIVLKRGITIDDNLLAWFHHTTGAGAAATGAVERSTAAITMVDRQGKALRAWELMGAIPVRWTGPTFAAGSPSIPEEELEVAHHGFRVRSY